MPAKRNLAESALTRRLTAAAGCAFLIGAASIPASSLAKQQFGNPLTRAAQGHVDEAATAPTARLVSVRMTTMDLGVLNASEFGDNDANHR